MNFNLFNLGNTIPSFFKNRKNKKNDELKQKILKKILENEEYQWRKISTLAAAIGCDEETTKHHLIAINARGSMKNDGMWGLLSRNPLEKIKRKNI